MDDVNGSFSGNDFVVILMDGDGYVAFSTKLYHGRMVGAKRVEEIRTAIDNQGWLKVEVIHDEKEVNEGSDELFTFDKPPTVSEFEDIVLMQMTKIRLQLRDEKDPFQSVFVDPATPIKVRTPFFTFLGKDF